jgi:hypothetical protein
MKSYVGHPKSELYLRWGPPTSVTSDGNGGEILIYESYVSQGQIPGSAYNNGYGGVSYTAPQQRGYTKTRMFYVDKDGIIYTFSWQGL